MPINIDKLTEVEKGKLWVDDKGQPVILGKNGMFLDSAGQVINPDTSNLRKLNTAAISNRNKTVEIPDWMLDQLEG